MDRKLILTFVAVLAITAGIGVAILVTAWTNPSGNPPTGSGSLSGAIMYFAASTCPTGWSEVTAARGRYIVGLPASGSVSSTVGTALTDQENRPAGQHTHSVTVKWPFGGGDFGSGSYANFSETSRTTDSGSGLVAGTNAPYIQFIVCQKT